MILSNLRERRRGNVVVLVAFLVTILVGVAAVAIDGGTIMDDVQKVQAAADASALAAAEQLYKLWQTGNGFDVGSAAKNAALALAATNGYSNDGTDSQITPNAFTTGVSGQGGGGGNITVIQHGIFIPPKTGDHVLQAGYVEVVIQYNQKRNFSSIYGTDRIQVRARAVAEGGWRAGNAGILLLDPASSGSLTVVGGGTMNVLGAPLIVDSNAADAVTSTGGGHITVSSDQHLDVSGSPGVSGSGTVTGTIRTNQPPTPDPLAYLPEPSPTGATVYNKVNVAGNRVETVSPGVYNGGIQVSGQGSLIMNPGIYYMVGGGFSFTGSGSLSAIGVMIVNIPSSNSDRININGSGAITLSPMTTGLYRGISLWQQRSSTNEIDVTGNGATQVSGTFYAQHGVLNVTGNGGTDVLGSQYISYDMKVNGGGTFNVNWDPNLVGRTRIIRLVE
jgi:Flp pilus assembly protein TadG